MLLMEESVLSFDEKTAQQAWFTCFQIAGKYYNLLRLTC